ncbi:MAG: hypothetical protein RL026_2391 [Pseudomonadota bacterium]
MTSATPAALARLASIALLALAALSPGPSQAAGPREVPALESRVTDETGTLTAAEQATLEQQLLEFEQRKGAQLAVLIVPTTAPEAIEQFSIRVVEAWRLGREASDDGVLLLVAKDDRDMRIEVGRGLEGALTDATSRRIIDEIIAPLFREGDYAGGVQAGLQRIMKVVEGEPLPPPEQGWQAPADDVPALLPLLLVAGLGVGALLRAIFGRLLGAVVAAGLAGVVGLFVTAAVVQAGVLAAAAFFITLLGDVMLAMLGHSGAGRGRDGGFGGSGGFGAGGFGGGGGSFGGGGASGRW